jgi:hypothetical protein
VRRQRHVPCARSTQKLSIRRQHNVSSNYAHRVLRHRRVPPNPLSMYPATDSQSEITVSRTPSISSFMLSGVSIVSENDKFDVSSSDDEDGLESRMVSSNQRRSSHRRSSSYYGSFAAPFFSCLQLFVSSFCDVDVFVFQIKFLKHWN